MKYIKKIVIVASTLCLAAIIVNPVLAEGEWNSHIHLGRTGFESREWEDKQLHEDEVKDTTITFDGCRDLDPDNGSADSVGVRLTRVRNFRPDFKHSIEKLDCYYSAQASWSDVEKGIHYFVITDVSGSTNTGHTFEASSVKVSY